MFIINWVALMLLSPIIYLGLKPIWLNDLCKKTLQKNSAIIFPVNPKECFLKKEPVMLVPNSPVKMLLILLKRYLA